MPREHGQKIFFFLRFFERELAPPIILPDNKFGRLGWVVGQLNQQPVGAGEPESLEDLEDQVDLGRNAGVGLTLSSRVAWCTPWGSGRKRQSQPTPISPGGCEGRVEPAS